LAAALFAFASLLAAGADPSSPRKGVSKAPDRVRPDRPVASSPAD